MTTKLKIDLIQGVLEVEGSEVFVRAIYSDFKTHFIGEEAGETSLRPPRRRRSRSSRSKKDSNSTTTKTSSTTTTSAKATAESKADAKTDKSAKPEPPAEKAPKKEAAAETLSANKQTAPPPAESESKSIYKVVPDLELTATEDHRSLVEFMDTKFPITNEERNLVFVYYLQHQLKVKPITADHIYTCYKEVNIRVPLHLESSLETTATQHRWIRITKTGKLSVTPAGKLYVEKQLPKKLKN